MIEHLGSVISDAILRKMRAWLAGKGIVAGQLTDRDVIAAIAQRYTGGVERFLTSGQAPG